MHSVLPLPLQVVSGMNYEVVASISCPDPKSVVKVDAVVYVPLPYTNLPPNVRPALHSATLPRQA